MTMEQPDNERIREILLVEDNPGDIRLAKEALKEGGINHHLQVAMDGKEALAILHGEGALPDLIFLDLNLPKMDGREVLAQIKADDRLKRIPVVVLTTSSAEADIVKAYNLHANCYVTKPVDLERFIDLVKEIENFWMTVVRLPGRDAAV
jgi:two-component system, chemotaxis family, response regulator Rcp1